MTPRAISGPCPAGRLPLQDRRRGAVRSPSRLLGREQG